MFDKSVELSQWLCNQADDGMCLNVLFLRFITQNQKKHIDFTKRNAREREQRKMRGSK